MRTPESLLTLVEYGLVDEVIRPLMSGKEAQIYLVWSQGEERVAKVYREAEHRNFKHRVQYTEGRKTRNSRDQRARSKRTSYGRAQDEAAWRAAEVDMIYRLSAAGVTVPQPYHFVDSVLIMEMVQDEDGNPAPRLGDLDLPVSEAAVLYERLLREVVRMLAAGVVHGDLSDFNVLLGAQGPVIIDFPQSVDASANTGARKLLIRDVENLHNFAKRSGVSAQRRPYAEEMWDLYQRGELTPDTVLRGQFKAATAKVDTRDVLGLIREAEDDERFRRRKQGRPQGGLAQPRRDARDAAGAVDGDAQRPPPGPPPRRREIVLTEPARPTRNRPRKGDRPAPRGNQPAPRNDRPAPQGNRPAPHGNRPSPRPSHSAEAPRHGQDAQGAVPLTEGQRRRRRRKPRPPQPFEPSDAGQQGGQGRAPTPPRQKPHARADLDSRHGSAQTPRHDRARNVAAHPNASTDGDMPAPKRRRRRRRPRGGGGGNTEA